MGLIRLNNMRIGVSAVAQVWGVEPSGGLSNTNKISVTGTPERSVNKSYVDGQQSSSQEDEVELSGSLFRDQNIKLNMEN